MMQMSVLSLLLMLQFMLELNLQQENKKSLLLQHFSL